MMFKVIPLSIQSSTETHKFLTKTNILTKTQNSPYTHITHKNKKHITCKNKQTKNINLKKHTHKNTLLTKTHIQTHNLKTHTHRQKTHNS